MQLVNEFVVPRGIDETWAVLTDVERIAPAMPGAQLTGVEDGKYSGTVKVKVGPVTAAYAGIASFRELDEANHRATLDATGKESSGRGRAAAVVTAELSAEGGQTRVKVTTDLTISGPLAQFGRGAIGEVSTRLLNQFVTNLKETVLVDSAPAAAPVQPAASTDGGDTGAAAPTTDPPSAVADPADPPAASGQDSAAATAGGDPAATAAVAGADAAPVTTRGDAEPNPPADPTNETPPDGATSPAAPAATTAAPTTAAPTNPAPTNPAPSTAAPTTPAPATSVPTAPAPAAAAPAANRPTAAPAAEVNLLRIAAWPILKRLIPLLVVVVVIVLLIVWLV